MEVNRQCLESAMQAFPYKYPPIDAQPYGDGHINDTFAVEAEVDGERKIAYILQRINNNVFKKPHEVMDNIFGVTEYLRQELLQNGTDPHRRVLHLLRTKQGEKIFYDAEARPWRSYIYVGESFCYNTTPSLEVFGQSGYAFGRFLKQLQDYPAHTLHETIPHFHDTPSRVNDLQAAIDADVASRVASCQPEIEFALSRAKSTAVLVEMTKAGSLPLRVTHNDTKLNNILFDNTTKEAICVIDLDTIMPGLSLNDFGDSIRFGATTAAEDETDLSAVEFSLPLFEAYTSEYLRAAADALTENEVNMLAQSARILTYECGVRFLADYLSGDVYFKTARDHHNLDRCRTQFKLVADMERDMPSMEIIVQKYTK